MSAADSIVVMGQVVASFGVRGWIRVRPYTEATAALLDYEAWWVRPAGKPAWHEVRRLAGRTHSGAVVAQLAGVETREEALALRGAEIGIARSMLPQAAQDEVYWVDLIGLDVVNREGVRLGQVAAVQDYGGHPVLRVRGGDAGAPVERLIPYVPAHVDGVDLAARRIEVDWQPDY